MKKLLTWVLSTVMSLSPATAANTGTTEAPDTAATAIVAEAETTTEEAGSAADNKETTSPADDKDYTDMMNEWASEVQNWTYLADEDVWVIPVNAEKAPADGEAPARPEGEAPDGEVPEKPDGETPEGEAPAKPEGEAPDADKAPQGEKPDAAPERPEGEAPDGAKPADGEAPEKPDGEAPDDATSGDTDKKGGSLNDDVPPLQGIPGDLVIGVDTDSDGTVDVTADSYTESVTGVLIWADGAELTELVEIETE